MKTEEKASAGKIPLNSALILPIVALILFSVGFVGLFSHYNGRLAVRDLARQLRSDVSLRITEHLDRFMKTPHLIDRINANAVLLGQIDTTDQAALEKYFWRQAGMFETVSSIYLGNPRGGHVNSGREGAGGDRYVIVTDNFERGSFDKYATDENGNRTKLVATVPNFDSSKRQWYMGAVNKGGPYWSPVYVLFTGQDMAIAGSLPAYSPDGDLLGVFSVDIFLSQIGSFLESIDIGENGKSFIIERSGLMIATSAGEKPFTRSEGDKKSKRIFANESSDPVIRNAAQYIIENTNGLETINSEKQIEFEMDGNRYYVQISPFADANGLDWLVVVAITESDFLRHIKANTRTTVLLTLLTLLITVIVGIMMAKWINGPVKQLADTAGAMTEGEWTGPISHDTRLLEVSRLIYLFNNMGEQLEQEKSALVESELRFRTLVNNMPIGLFRNTAGTHGRFLMVNPALARMHDYTVEEMVGNPVSNLYANPTQRKVISDKLVNEGLILGEEIRLKRKDGVRFWAQVTAFTVRDENGDILYFDGMIENIDARKKAEEELISQRNLLQTITDGIPDIVALKNPDRSIISYNRAGYESIGKAPEDVIGEKCFTLIGRDTPCPGCSIDKSLETGNIEINVRYEKTVGKWFESRAIPIVDKDGRIEMFVEILRDITREKEHQKEKEKLQTQLIQSQKMEAIGLLAGGMAHDFNNMLGIIMGYSQLVLSEMDDDRYREEIETILDAAKRSKDLTMKLLTFSRKDKLNVKRTKVSALVENVLSILQRSMKKKIAIRYVPDNDAEIEVDENQIHHALLNICNNAGDAMPDGGVLSIEHETIDIENHTCNVCGKKVFGRFLRINIKDTGAGMDKKTISKIFEPFYTTKGAGKGTGLGMSVTLGIIQSHDGHISATSEVGDGTTIQILLPTPSTEISSEEVSEKRVIKTAGTETILVIDDETNILRFTKRLLERGGYHAVVVDNGKEAIEFFREYYSDIDLVLLDILMPAMDGAEVMDALLRIAPNVKIVLASGYSMDGQAEALMEKGARGFLQKPVSNDDLMQTIREVLDES